MNRELKLALIFGLSAVLGVMVLISDHFSKLRQQDLAPLAGDEPGRLTMVGNRPAEADPFTPEAPLVQPNPLPEKPANPTPELDQSFPDEINQTRPVNPTPGEKTPETPGLATAPADKDYTIAEGDTLYKLSKRFYDNPSLFSKLAEYNKLGDGRGLKVGMKIKVPHIDVLMGRAKPGTAPATPQNESIRPRPIEESPIMSAKQTVGVYKVVSGDTLHAIARKAGVPVKTLLEANPGLRGREDELKVGMELRVPREAGRN